MPAAKKSYSEMIEETLMTLNERGGSSRQAVWKACQAKFPDAEYKYFLVRLQSAAKEGTSVIFGKSKQRFALVRKLMDKVKRSVKSGNAIVSAKQLHKPRKVAAKKAAMSSKKRAAKAAIKERKAARKVAAKSKAKAKRAAAAEKKKAAKAKKTAAVAAAKAKKAGKKNAAKSKAKAAKPAGNAKTKKTKTDKKKANTKKVAATKTKN
jgi:colicin import membrane protein